MIHLLMVKGRFGKQVWSNRNDFWHKSLNFKAFENAESKRLRRDNYSIISHYIIIITLFKPFYPL